MSGGRVVALTGGTGFIGPYLIQALTAQGWQIRLLVRPGRQRTIASHVETVEGSLDDNDALDRLLDGVDVLIHAAGAIKARSRADFLRVNRDGTRRLAEKATNRRNPPRMVMISSLAAREPHLSDYAFSKAAGELAFQEHNPDGSAIVRPSAVYGPGDRETGAWLRAAWGPFLPIPRVPHARLCLIHAADVAAAVASLCPPNAPCGTFELSDQRVAGYGWRELAQIVLDVSGGKRFVEIPPQLLHAAAFIGGLMGHLSRRAVMLTPGKAREILHPDWSSSPDRQPPSSLWRPVHPLREGLAQTFNSMRLASAAPAQV